jgi:hypothetical protein
MPHGAVVTLALLLPQAKRRTHRFGWLIIAWVLTAPSTTAPATSLLRHRPGVNAAILDRPSGIVNQDRVPRDMAPPETPARAIRRNNGGSDDPGHNFGRTHDVSSAR